MALSRTSFEFCALMLLGVVLFAAAFLIFAQPRLPAYARIDAIEERFAPQIERLRTIALTNTGGFTAGSNQPDRDLFAVPGMLRAMVEISRNSWTQYYGAEFDYGGTWSRVEREPAPNRPVVTQLFRRLGSGDELVALEYDGVVVRPDGSRRQYRITLDARELRSRWEAEGGGEEE
jgi:hypothetical protein